MGRCQRCGCDNGFGEYSTRTCPTCMEEIKASDEQRREKMKREEEETKLKANSAPKQYTSADYGSDGWTKDHKSYDSAYETSSPTYSRSSRRGFGKIIIIVIVIVAFLLLGVAGTYFAHFLGTSRTLAEKNYEKYLSFFEGDSLLDDSSPDITLDTFKKNIENSRDCMLYIFDEENCSRIQKYTGNGKTTYVFDIRSDLFEGLSQGTYWYDGEKIVTSTEEEKAYYPSSQEYAALLEKLTRLLPQNFIPCEVPEKSIMYLPTDKDIMAYKLTGENTSIVINYELTDDGHDDYYEKTDKRLIRVSFVRTTMIKSMPDSEEYKEIR